MATEACNPRLRRLLRQLRARTVPQAVLRSPNGRYELMPADSQRVDLLLASASWRQHMIGVFSPDVSLTVLSREVSA